LFFFYDNRGVLVKFYMRTVRAFLSARAPDDYRVYNLAFFNNAAGRRLFNRAYYNVAYIRVFAARAAQDAYAHKLFRARIVGDFQI
jgi:hypothetical protein